MEKGYIEDRVAAKTLRDLRKKDAKALFFIQKAMDDVIFRHISTATRSKEAWDGLNTTYKGTVKVVTFKLQTLCRKFESFLMRDGDVLSDYISNVIDVVNQIRKYGEDLM